MIETTLNEVERRGWQRVGILGFLDPRTLVYSEPMQSRGLDMLTIDPSLQPPLDAAIRLLAEGRENDQARAAAQNAVDALRAQNADGIILGCTEIPPLVNPAPDLLSPLEHLAEAAVERSIG
jgi:aspartate racemase